MWIPSRATLAACPTEEEGRGRNYGQWAAQATHALKGKRYDVLLVPLVRVTRFQVLRTSRLRRLPTGERVYLPVHHAATSPQLGVDPGDAVLRGSHPPNDAVLRQVAVHFIFPVCPAQ